MALRADTDEHETFLVEHYRPGLDVGALETWARSVRDAVNELEGEGKPVRFLRSLIVPRDQSFLCVIDAGTEQLVREAYARAGIPFERISQTIVHDA